MSSPLCLKLTLDENDTNNTLNKYQLRVSDMKFGDVSARRFPHRWVSLESDAEGWHPGLHIVCTEYAHLLPIVYAAEGGESLLLRITSDNKTLVHALTELEGRIRAALPTEEQSMLQPILRIPDTPGYDQSVSVKIKYTDVHPDSTGSLEKNNILEKCILKVQRLNYYMGKIYCSLQLVCCLVGEGIASQQGTTGQCSTADYYEMMELDCVDVSA
jgi:hypothetical protein